MEQEVSTPQAGHTCIGDGNLCKTGQHHPFPLPLLLFLSGFLLVVTFRQFPCCMVCNNSKKRVARCCHGVIAEPPFVRGFVFLLGFLRCCIEQQNSKVMDIWRCMHSTPTVRKCCRFVSSNQSVRGDTGMGCPKCIWMHPAPSFFNGNVLFLWETFWGVLWAILILLVIVVCTIGPLLIHPEHFHGTEA